MELSTDSLLSADSLEEQRLSDSQSVNCVNQEEDDPVTYLDREVFPVLLPCLEKVLFAAKENNVLKVQKSLFNGIDYLAELLWNGNPLYPERQQRYTTIFEIPFVKDHLAHYPRLVYPRSWLWSQAHAAVVIQAGLRGYWVRRSPQVQEMRQFWKAISEEKRLKQEEKTLRECEEMLAVI